MRRPRALKAAPAVVAVALLASGLAGSAPAAADTKDITAYFTSAISVYGNGSVKVLGLNAGRVTKVEPQGDKVMVKMKMDGDVPLPEDVKATVVPGSLIGERYIQLFPAWTEGKPKAPSRLVIPVERTSVPVEPDEALAALKRLLDGLDPNATGRLVKNLAEDLDGQGQNLSSALSGLSRLTRTLADKDQQIAGIIDNMDRLTATLRTRESQLASVIDKFARTASLLAEERQQLQQLLRGLGNVSVDAYELIRSNRVDLKDDLDTLSRLLVSVSANLDSIKTLLETAPVIVAGRDLDGVGEGLLAAYDPAHHLIDLRTQVSPLVGNAIGRILAILGVPTSVVCLPIDVTCEQTTALATQATAPMTGAIASPPGPQLAAPATAAPPAATAARTAPAAPAAAPTTTTAPPAATAPPPTTPLDQIIDLLRGGRVTTQSASVALPLTADRPSRGVGAWLRRTARTAVEAVS
jgi:phospholipid/cholesterol/gamma-HCH transport system substrate-binding protein